MRRKTKKSCPAWRDLPCLCQGIDGWQGDELASKVPYGKAGMATAICVFGRPWLWAIAP